MRAKVDIVSPKGTQEYSYAAMYDTDGVTELSCMKYASRSDDLNIGAAGLTTGQTYYIRIGTSSVNYRGTFTLCLEDVLDYDYFEAAEDITSLIGTCSADAAYTTVDATPDKNPGSCTSTGKKQNRWFKFVATSTGVMKVSVLVGGSKGNQQSPQLAIWDSDGETELMCFSPAPTNNTPAVAGVAGLVDGNTYYISVDTQSSSKEGSFTICLDDTPSYDYFEYAEDVTSLFGTCSADQAYTTAGMSLGKRQSTCATQMVQNCWFKFQASTSFIRTTVDVGGSKGSMGWPRCTLWETDGTTQLTCAKVDASEDIAWVYEDLTPGNWYYISVDAAIISRIGTFPLCLANAKSQDYDYYEGAIDVTSLLNDCSSDAEYSTITATADMNGGSWWGNTIVNRWFKFNASTSY